MARDDREMTKRIDADGFSSVSRESVAYDYSRFDKRERLAPPPPELTVMRSASRRAKARAGINPNLFLMLFIIGALAVGVVMSSVKLSEKTFEASNLKDDLAKLNSEATILQTRQDEKFSLAAVETYAVDHLGMTKVTSDQIKYVDISNPDKVEVLDPNQEDKTPLYAAIIDKLKGE